MIELLIKYLLGHFLADFPLQGQYLAETKGKDNISMFAHCMIYAGVISLLVGFQFWVFCVLFISHWLIDRYKCNGWISLLLDQCFHIIIILIIFLISL